VQDQTQLLFLFHTCFSTRKIYFNCFPIACCNNRKRSKNISSYFRTKKV